MAEFGMRTSASQGNFDPSMQWYSAPANYQASQYQYPAAQQSYNTYATFEDEPPLLEELGIDIAKILLKTRAIMFHRLNSKYLDDLDMGGALIFLFTLAGLHLLMGKLHFGVILGWGVVQSLVMYFVVNQLAGVDTTAIDLYGSCCLIGYCMVPMVVFSAAALMIPRGVVVEGLAGLAAIWSAFTAARLFVKRLPGMSDSMGLLAYPCLLVYGSFALLTVY